ncbi:hypothetical protein WG906_01010 [Pedobacter sp. P351]|uniref:hypothetical protein n=1 Tax=Pedobacter superstes TaxID=3133441 RepID=UPI0030975388
MKKTLLALAVLGTFTFSSNAQINLSAGATYSNYGSDIGNATPGIQLRGAYNISRKKAVALGVAYSLPVKQTIDYGAGSYEQTSSFISGNLFGIFHLIGGYDNNFSLYFPLGISYVLGEYKAVSSAATTTQNEKLNGLTFNLNLGTQFRIGSPLIFAEAGFAIPSGNTSNTQTGVTGTNLVPAHSILQLGVRLPLGSDSRGGKSNGQGGKGGGKRSPNNRGDNFM